MNRFHPHEDPDRRWRRFSRPGWRLAGLAAALWFGVFALLFRLASPPVPALRPAPAAVAWWPPAVGAGLDMRSLWTPAVFALATPAGFTHALRRGRIGLAPPVEALRPAAAYLGNPRPPPPPGPAMAGDASGMPAAAPVASWPVPEVFPPRTAAAEAPRLEFSAGWESRLFSGIDLNFGQWTNQPWTARIEMQFDAKGVPVSMLLAQASGLPEVDRRLVRSASGWRLLESGAVRQGTVSWCSPAAPAAAGGPAP